MLGRSISFASIVFSIDTKGVFAMKLQLDADRDDMSFDWEALDAASQSEKGFFFDFDKLEAADPMIQDELELNSRLVAKADREEALADMAKALDEEEKYDKKLEEISEVMKEDNDKSHLFLSAFSVEQRHALAKKIDGFIQKEKHDWVEAEPVRLQLADKIDEFIQKQKDDWVKAEPVRLQLAATIDAMVADRSSDYIGHARKIRESHLAHYIEAEHHMDESKQHTELAGQVPHFTGATYYKDAEGNRSVFAGSGTAHHVDPPFAKTMLYWALFNNYTPGAFAQLVRYEDSGIRGKEPGTWKLEPDTNIPHPSSLVKPLFFRIANEMYWIRKQDGAGTKNFPAAMHKWLREVVAREVVAGEGPARELFAQRVMAAIQQDYDTGVANKGQ